MTIFAATKHKIVFLYFLVFSTLAPAKDEWTRLYEEDGILVEQNKAEALPQFRASGILDLNFYEVFTVLADISRRTEWVENLVEIKTLTGDVTSKLVVYSRFDLPWPAADRDSVVEATVSLDKNTKSATVLFKTASEAFAAERPGVVRVKTVTGLTVLKYIDDKHTEISEQILMDPGGYLPQWVAKIFIQDVPIKTLKALKMQVNKTRGQYQEQIRAL